MYTWNMDVAVTDLRAHLGKWIDEARNGADVVITDRGMPVARIVALDASPTIERLVSRVIRRPVSVVAVRVLAFGCGRYRCSLLQTS